jgi:hypothetical protein
MTREEYEACVSVVVAQAQMFRLLPIEEVLRAIEFTESVGPILDPTLYRATQDTVRVHKQLLSAALEFKRVAARLGARVEPLGSEMTSRETQDVDLAFAMKGREGAGLTDADRLFSPGEPRTCRYDDCPEGHPSALDDELVSCETCRRDLGLPPLDQP